MKARQEMGGYFELDFMEITVSLSKNKIIYHDQRKILYFFNLVKRILQQILLERGHGK